MHSWRSDDVQYRDLTVRWSRRRFMKVVGGTAAAATLTGLLAACGGEDEEEPSTGETSGEATVASGGSATEATGSVGTTPASDSNSDTGVAGGSVTYVTSEEPETLNPYLTQLVVGVDVISLFLEPLMQADETGQYGPRLAESNEVSEDGLTWTFTLRQGVKWHDGTDFTASDVVETYNMIMNPDFGAFDQQGWDKVTAVETPDDHTVVFTLGQVYAPFMAFAGGTEISPASELTKGVQVFKEEFGRKPVGTGPFTFQEWTSGDHVTANAFADYWGGAPKLESVTTKFVPNSNTILVQLKAGEADITAYAEAQQHDELAKIEDKQMVALDGQGWYHLDLKNISFLMEKEVRQALDFATPKQDIIDKILNGLATISVADVAPISWAYNPNIEPRPYDIEQAKQLLEDAGWTAGSDGVREKDGTQLKMELWGIAGDQQGQQILQVIAASWKQIGVEAELKFQDIQTLWGPEGYQFTETPTACGYAWFNENDPDDTFYWHSSQIPETPTGTGGNLPAYFNEYSFQAEIDELTERGVSTLDQEERKQIYWEIQELLHEEVPVIFIYWGQQIFVSPKTLQGFAPSAFTRLFYNVHEWSWTA